MKKQAKIPVILYESEEQALPYIEVEQKEMMPEALFIQEYKHTGEVEPGADGEDQPIVDMMIHMYVNMGTLAEKLSPELYDQVRTALDCSQLIRLESKDKKSWIKFLKMLTNAWKTHMLTKKT